MDTQNIKDNPFVRPFTLNHQALPFNEIKNEHYLPALKWGIENARVKIKNIKESQDISDFENTILALEMASETVDLVSTTFYNQLNAHTNDELQKLAGEIGPLLSNFQNDIILDEDLFKKIEAVHYAKASLGLNKEQEKLLEDTYTEFTRNGSLLSTDRKEKLRKIDEELSKLSPQFSENVLNATNQFQLVVEDEKDLKGLPEGAIEAAAIRAEQENKKGKWVFTLDAPSYVPFMKYAENRELREKLYRAYGSRSFNDEYDNQEIILKTVKLRYERALLLGFNDHADFILKRRMAATEENVVRFLERLLEKSKPAAEKDVAEVQALADELNGPKPLQSWDFSFYAEKLKQRKFQFDEEELRPYFQLEKVIDGVFEHAKRLYGLQFIETSDYPTYHEDVKVYEVHDSESDEFMGLFYTDFFPRETKSGGAWMTNYMEQGLFAGEIRRPHVAIVCNFTKPTPNKPSLLTFNEVQTLFHEFGHSLHGLLSQCKYRSHSGANVYWDFVELPSQILENWTLEQESLHIYAHHYKTGELIPADLAKKIKESSQFLAGYYCLRQVTLSLIDMGWHTGNPESIEDVSEFEQSIYERTKILPYVDGTNFSCGFGHIFAGGYSAGYYSYKWAEVLDADAFEYFQEKGIFSEEVAKSFKEHILSKGGTEHPMELYKKFRGREPDPDALLRRDGLI